MHLRVFVRTAAFVVLLSALSSSTFAATIVFLDDFNKADGPLLGTTPNISTGSWTITGTSTTNPIQISSNAVAMQTTGQDAYGQFSTAIPHQDGTVLHTGMDINVSAAQTGDYFSHLSDTPGTTTNFYQRLGAVATTGGYFLTLTETSGTGATTVTGTTVLSFGTSYHVDVNWTFVPGPTNDTFDVLVNGSPYASKTWTSVTAEPTQVGAANLRQGGATSSATLKIDNLQVDVPEPSSFALLAIGCCVLCGRRRFA